MKSQSCPGPSRREVLGAGVAGALGLALSPMLQRLLAEGAPARRAKSCILLWLNGGPSHIDTFDPKPGAKTGGPFKAIDTKVSGLRLSEHLPKLAAQAGHLAVVRSLTSRQADHDLAYYYLHTGNVRNETVDYPALGSVVAREWTAEDGDLPAYVALSGGSAGAGFFGVEYSPYVIANLDAPIGDLALPEGTDEKRRERQLKALKAFNGRFAGKVDAGSAAAHERFTAKALRLRQSPALKAFDLGDEKATTLAAYGLPAKPAEGAPAPAERAPAEEPSAFGRSCLLARRLVEQGVRFVEITLDGWDTHTDNFTAVEALSKQLDTGFAALVGDLKERGLLKDTLVLCMGEFGRTPQINAQNGRDHWSEAFSVVLAGGGIRGGQVVGATDAQGEQVKERPVTVPDLYATLLAAFGLDGTRQYRTPEGRPIRLADKGKVVKELFA
jgi:uncharacterized protein (DUF1501 family)